MFKGVLGNINIIYCLSKQEQEKDGKEIEQELLQMINGNLKLEININVAAARRSSSTINIKKFPT